MKEREREIERERHTHTQTDITKEAKVEKNRTYKQRAGKADRNRERQNNHLEIIELRIDEEIKQREEKM